MLFVERFILIYLIYQVAVCYVATACLFHLFKIISSIPRQNTCCRNYILLISVSIISDKIHVPPFFQVQVIPTASYLAGTTTFPAASRKPYFSPSLNFSSPCAYMFVHSNKPIRAMCIFFIFLFFIPLVEEWFILIYNCSKLMVCTVLLYPTFGVFAIWAVYSATSIDNIPTR